MSALAIYDTVLSYLTFAVLLLLLLLLPSTSKAEADVIGIVWGQYPNEGTLAETCATGMYSLVTVALVDIMATPKPPIVDLPAGHCTLSDYNKCRNLSSDIKFCQKQGIRVLVDIAGFEANVTSPQDAHRISDYLWNNFLGGGGGGGRRRRPLGDAEFDGVDFAVMSRSIYTRELARRLKSRSIYVSATADCDIHHSGYSVLDSGFFDHISIIFTNNPSCMYKDGNADNLLRSWKQWSMLKHVRKLFVGLQASSSVDAGIGFVPAHVLNNQILPIVRESPKYGGVNLWARYFDKQSGFSESIRVPLCGEQSVVTPLSQCDRRGTNFTESFGHMSVAGFRIVVNGSDVKISRRCCEAICRNNCSCDAYAATNDTTGRGCQIWGKDSTFNGSLGSQGQRIYVATKKAEHTAERSSRRHAVVMLFIWIIIGVGGSIAIAFVCYLSWTFWNKYKEKVSTENIRRMLINDIGGIAMLRKMNNASDEIEIFSFESMVAATNNFCDSNKLGEGGFGAVYMGRLQNQQEIAIKRLSRSSGQGLKEFKNEAKLIAKLQHTNLVKLLGLCIEREERMLIYEYLSNRSLDFHLFDAKRKEVLDWGKRLNIIEGIAHGLLYLHKYSRFKVIHRDLKAGNILLDDEMNPKISDFGMARILGLTGSEELTNRIVGTYGYMSPEYAMNGIVSTKIDVFSFGVLLLEIISGKKNNSFYDPNIPLNLIGCAWKLWNEAKAGEIMDPGLHETCNPREVMRCIHIGLLCVQEHARDRPTMFEVVSFLSNDAIQLAQPMQPAFFINGCANHGNMPSNTQQMSSIYYVTISDVDGR